MHYGSDKLTQTEYRDRIVKYPLKRGLKNYQILLPKFLSRKIGKYHNDDHNDKRLFQRHFTRNIPAEEGRKRKIPTRCCFVCIKLPGLKGNRSSFWCEDCGNALCISPCFQMYHTHLDYKLNAHKF